MKRRPIVDLAVLRQMKKRFIERLNTVEAMRPGPKRDSLIDEFSKRNESDLDIINGYRPRYSIERMTMSDLTYLHNEMLKLRSDYRDYFNK